MVGGATGPGNSNKKTKQEFLTEPLNVVARVVSPILLLLSASTKEFMRARWSLPS